MPTGGALTLCDTCRFWDKVGGAGFCRRHAPSASERPFQVARWPETRATDGCGEGEPRDSGSTDATGPEQICKLCVFWHRPGIGIEPGQRGDHLRAWWRDAGYCRRFAPRPGVDIGEHAFWRATHATDHCFDGQPA